MELSKAFSALQSKGAVHNFVNFVKNDDNFQHHMLPDARARTFMENYSNFGRMQPGTQGRIKVLGGPRLDSVMGPYPSFISYFDYAH